MATVDRDHVFVDEEIRVDTTVNSSIAATGEFQAETIVIYNGLNEDVVIQLQGSLDDSVWINIGSSFTVTNGTNDYETVTDYFPSYRVTAKCATAPTTGDINVWVLKAGAVT